MLSGSFVPAGRAEAAHGLGSEKQVEAIRAAVSAVDAGRVLGLVPDRRGYCRCPFHAEKTAGLRLYDGSPGWYCFGCHKGGDVISLYRELLGLSFREAVERIGRDFGLYGSSPRPAAIQAVPDDQLDRMALDLYRAAVDLVNLLEAQIAENRPDSKDEEWSPAFVQGLRRITEARELAEDLAVK